MGQQGSCPPGGSSNLALIGRSPVYRAVRVYGIQQWQDIRPAINGLDNIQPGLLLCPHNYDSWVREEGVTPSRSRRCEWGRNPHCHCPPDGWEGAGSRVNHEPEDLPNELTIVPSRAGEQARMKNRVQSSRSLSGLGDFLFGIAWPLDPDLCGGSCCHRDGWLRRVGLR